MKEKCSLSPMQLLDCVCVCVYVCVCEIHMIINVKLECLPKMLMYLFCLCLYLQNLVYENCNISFQIQRNIMNISKEFSISF